jgi:hypothetical protein
MQPLYSNSKTPFPYTLYVCCVIAHNTIEDWRELTSVHEPCTMQVMVICVVSIGLMLFDIVVMNALNGYIKA